MGFYVEVVHANQRGLYVGTNRNQATTTWRLRMNGNYRHPERIDFLPFTDAVDRWQLERFFLSWGRYHGHFHRNINRPPYSRGGTGVEIAEQLHFMYRAMHGAYQDHGLKWRLAEIFELPKEWIALWPT